MHLLATSPSLSCFTVFSSGWMWEGRKATCNLSPLLVLILFGGIGKWLCSRLPLSWLKDFGIFFKTYVQLCPFQISFLLPMKGFLLCIWGLQVWAGAGGKLPLSKWLSEYFCASNATSFEKSLEMKIPEPHPKPLNQNHHKLWFLKPSRWL